MRSLLLSFVLLSLSCGQDEKTSLMAGYDPAHPQASLDAIAAGASGAHLEFSQDVVDLGDVMQGTESPLSFPFVVRGNESLIVTGIETSCGCTDASLEVNGQPYVLSDPLHPGTEGVLRGTFSSAGFQDRKDSKITLRGNGLGMPRHLRVLAVVHPMFDLTPNEVRFGNVAETALSGDKPPSIEVEVISGQPFEIQRWVATPPGVAIEALGEPRMHEDGVRQIRRFLFTLLPDCGRGRLYQSAVAKTSLDRTLDFVIQANVFGPVRYEPERRITFGMLEQGQRRTRRINARSAIAGFSLSIPRLELSGVEDGVFRTEIEEKEKGTLLVIRVHIETDVPIGRHNASLRCVWPEGSGISDEEWSVHAIVRPR